MDTEDVVAKKLQKILTEDVWPYSKRTAQRVKELYRRRGAKALTQRLDNEIRDALDHLGSIASSGSVEDQLANCYSLCEHIRRATVEPLEFLVEEVLRRIRPPRPRKSNIERDPYGKRWLGIPRNVLIKIRIDFCLWREYITTSFRIRPEHTTIMLHKIIEGERHLVEARKAKGRDTQACVKSLGLALDAFDDVSMELKGNSSNILFVVVLNILALVAGLGLTALLKAYW